MTTLKSVINTAMRKARILAAGEEASPEDFQDVKDELFRMVKTWRLENLMVYVNQIEQFDLQPGAAAYTIGDGATWDTERPIKIMSATLKDGAGVSYPLVSLTASEFSQLSHKGESGRPSRFYYHPTYPVAEVRFSKIPDDPFVELVMQQSLSLPTQLTDELEFPEGYDDAIIHNLAVRICPDFGKTAKPELLGLAVSFKTLIKRANATVPILKTDELRSTNTLGTYDINAGPG